MVEMDIIFHNSDIASKLFLIHHFFSPVKTDTDIINDYFVGGVSKALMANAVYRKDNNIFRKKALALEICNIMSIAQEYSNDSNELKKTLGSLEIKGAILSNDEMVKFEGNIKTTFDNIEQINHFLNDIFLFKLPKETHIILTKSPETRSFGETILFDPPLIGLSVNDKTRSVPAIVLHELLHVLIARSGIIHNSAGSKPDNSISTPRMFSETLIGYFAPYGILAQKLGMVNNISLSAIKETCRNVDYIPEVETLEKIMKEYENYIGQKNIWDFLNENNCGHLINQNILAQLRQNAER